MTELFSFGEFVFRTPAFLLFPIVLLLINYFRGNKTQARVLFPSLSILQSSPRGFRAWARGPILFLSSATFVAFLCIAAARPQKIEVLERVEESRNLMLALDISRSMNTRDFRKGFQSLSRLAAVQYVVNQFISARKDDRIGLVVFGSHAYLQSPLTKDHSIVGELVQQLRVGIAGYGTAIGDGLGLSLKRIEDIPGDAKAVILLTDGASNSGKVNPLQAAKVARDLGVKVHTIGIGGLPQSNFFALTQPQAEFDEETLRQVADLSGGVYFNAQDLSGLIQVYEQIDQLEQSEEEEIPRERVYEYYPLFALLALLTYLLHLLFARFVFLKVPA